MMKQVRLDLMKGNQGFVIDINNYRITPTRHNGIMKVIQRWKIDIDTIKEALKQNLSPSPNSQTTQSVGYVTDNKYIANSNHKILQQELMSRK